MLPNVVYRRIRELLKHHFPNTDIRLQDSNGKVTIMMYPLNDNKLYNFQVNVIDLFNALEHQTFDSEKDFFLKANIPKWMIENFYDKAKVLNKSTDK